MRHVQAARPGARLALVGSGSQRAELEAAAARYDLESSIVFRGARSDVAAELRSAAVFVSASHEEGWPNAIMEAMACQLPVVATAVGGTPELVENGSTGTLVGPRQPRLLADAILRYLEEPHTRSEHGAAGRARICAQFTIENTVAAYEQLYGELAP
jgi:glycosyltransferase involved in cell wall biosynthesis